MHGPRRPGAPTLALCLVAKPDCCARADVTPAAPRCRWLLNVPWSSSSSLWKALAPSPHGCHSCEHSGSGEEFQSQHSH